MEGEKQREQLVDEAMLILRATKDDDGAFATLYDFYFPRLYGYLFRRVGHRQTAEDILSTTFMKAFTGLHKYDANQGSFQSWLYRIATNNLIDHYRKDGKQNEVDISQMYHLESGGASPERVTEQNIDGEKIEMAMKKLKKSDQEVLQLKFFGELSNLEIAQTLEISANNVGVRVYRALKKFEKIYSEYV